MAHSIGTSGNTALLPSLVTALLLLVSPQSPAQTVSPVTIDDVVFYNIEDLDAAGDTVTGPLLTVNVSSTLETSVRIRLENSFTNISTPGFFWNFTLQEEKRIPALCENYPLSLSFPAPAGLYQLTITIEPADGGASDIFDSFETPADVRWSKKELWSGFHPYHGTANDPVNTLTGEFFFTAEPDLQLPGPMPLIFQRSYSSRQQPQVSTLPILGRQWRHNYDAAALRRGDSVRIVLPDGRPVDFVRDGTTWRLSGSYGRNEWLTSFVDTLIYGEPTDPLLYLFRPDGLLAAMEDGRGNRLQLSYNNRLLAEVTDGLGRSLYFSYDTLGRLVSVGDGEREVRFTFRSGSGFGGNLFQMTDPSGGRTTYFYLTSPATPRALLNSTFYPAGNKHYTNVYDTLFRVIRQSDAFGNESRFIYPPDSPLTFIVDPDGDTVTHRHNNRFLSGEGEKTLIEYIDQENNGVRIGYDRNRIATVLNRLGDSVRFGYHVNGLPGLFEDQGRQISNYVYRDRTVRGIPRYFISREFLPDGTERRFEYDEKGNLVSYTDPSGNVFSYTYNDRGLLLSETLPTGGVYRYTRSPDMNIASITDPSGNVTRFDYDRFSRLVKATWGDGTSRSFAWDHSDRLVGLTDEEGKEQNLEYDPNGNLIAITDADGETTRFRYDAADRIDTITDPLGNALTFDFTSFGRLSELRDRSGGLLRFEHDKRGLVTAVVDPAGRRFTQESDAEGRVVRVEDPLGNVTEFGYDRRGFITSMTSPRGQTFTLERDESGRIMRVVEPTGKATAITYDGNGQPTSIAEEEGIEARYERNGLGQATTIIDPNGYRWESEFDDAGRMVLRRDPLGRQTRLSLDARNRVDSVIFPEGMGSKVVTYDKRGYVVAERWSDGTEITYERDATGRTTAATGATFAYDATGALTNSGGIAIERDAGGRPTAITVAPGKRIEYEYHIDGRVKTVRDWTGEEITFSYDGEGKLERIERPNGVTTRYEYDADDRWGAILHGNLAEMRFERDEVGRIISATRDLPLSATLSPSTRAFTYNAAAERDGATHDAMGRIIREGNAAYGWDLASRLRSIDDEGERTDMRYNADGYLLSVARAGTEQEFVWNYGLGIPSISVERRDGSDAFYYIHTPGGRLLARVDALTGEKKYYHFNESGSVLFLTDEEGSITASYAYLPYGSLLDSQGEGGNIFTFGGEYGTISLGGDLYNMRARWYDGSVGRFLSPDPHRSTAPKEINPYQYTAGDPITYVDIDGMTKRNWNMDVLISDDKGEFELPHVLHTYTSLYMRKLARELRIKGRDPSDRLYSYGMMVLGLAMSRREDENGSEGFQPKQSRIVEETLAMCSAGLSEHIRNNFPIGSFLPQHPFALTTIPIAGTDLYEVDIPLTDEPVTAGGAAIASGGAEGTNVGKGKEQARQPKQPKAPQTTPGAPREGNRANPRQTEQASVFWAWLNGFWEGFGDLEYLLRGGGQ